MWINLGSITPNIFTWEQSNSALGYFSQVKITWVQQLNVDIKSRLLIRRNYSDFVDRPIVVYPDLDESVVIRFPEVNAMHWPKVEARKIISRKIRSYALAEDYRIEVAVFVED